MAETGDDVETGGAPLNARRPSLRKRLLVALLIATVAAPLAYLEPSRAGGQQGDFAQSWYSAVALLDGRNPYDVIGPGREWQQDFPLLYPLPAAIVALPLAWLAELPAAVVFVWISTALLAFAVTRDGWYLLPMFLSSAFVVSVRRVQWAPLLTAAMYLPWLGWAFVVKPNIGLALLLSMKSRRMVIGGLVGGAALVLISLLVLPRWPLDWLEATRSAGHTVAPIMQPGGFLILLALLRWRRWEARLILALACMPQSLFWYDVLPLLTIPRSFRESLILALVTSSGFLLEMTIASDPDVLSYYRRFGALLVAVAYMPAVLLVLHRSNTGSLPPWLDDLSVGVARRALGAR